MIATAQILTCQFALKVKKPAFNTFARPCTRGNGSQLTGKESRPALDG